VHELNYSRANLVSEYRVVKGSLALHFLLLVPFVLVAIFLTPTVLRSEEEIGGKVFICIWSVGVLFMVYYFLKMPYRINFDKTDPVLSFSSLFSKKHIEISRIRLIKVNINGTYVVFVHDRGKIRMINRIDNFHHLINELRSINSNINTKGC
jgi:hypothetical protein